MSDPITDPGSQPPGGAPPSAPSAPSGYTPPATQDELNRIIGERVTRVKSQYADYNDLKAKAARVDELEGKAAEVESTIAEVPSKVAAALREHLVTLHGIETDDADLFLTATDPETMLRQVDRLVDRSKKGGIRAPREGATTPPPPADETRELARTLFNPAGD